MEKQLGRKKGFTLLELILAMAILAIAMVAAYQAVMQTLDRDLQTRFDQLAPMLAHQKLEALDKHQTFFSSGLLKGHFAAPHEGFSWEARFRPATGTLLLDVNALQMIEVTVQHSSSGRRHQLRTYRKR